VALAQNGIQVNVVETVAGNVAYAGRPGYITADTLRWDAHSDDMYYFFRGAQVVRHKLSTNTTTMLVDYATDGHGFSGISGGGIGDVSKDNWMGSGAVLNTRCAYSISIKSRLTVPTITSLTRTTACP